MGQNISQEIVIRNLKGSDLEGLFTMDWRGLPKERSTINLLFCVHFQETSLVAEKDGAMVGILVGSTNTDNSLGFLNHIVVWKEWEGHGIGTKLINQWFELLKNLGVKKAWLHGDINLYKRYGFYDSKDIFDPSVMEWYRKRNSTVLVKDL
jgi:GNAT superfamily N-acetyltransferase